MPPETLGPYPRGSVANAALTETSRTRARGGRRRRRRDDGGDGARSGARPTRLITQKAPGVVFGLDVAAETFRALDPEMAVRAR